MLEKQSKWWNNGEINKRSTFSPGENFVLGRLRYKRKPHSLQTLEKISKSLCGNIPWNKGKTGIYSSETLEKMRLSKLGYKPSHSNKGNIPWNKGLTDDDLRVKSYIEKQKGKTRSGNYSFGEKHPNYNAKREDFERYRQTVNLLTEKTYVKYKQEINPNNYPRTLCGVDGGYQLDHIQSVKMAFDNGISPEEISSKENLQMLPWKINREKWSK